MQQRATPARKSVRCGVGARPLAPNRHGPRTPAVCTKDGRSTGEGRVTPDAPHKGRRSPLLGDPPPAPREAKSGGGPKARAPCRAPMLAHPHPERVGSEPRPPATWVRQPGESERMTPCAPHKGTRQNPGYALLQPLRQRAVGLVGPLATCLKHGWLRKTGNLTQDAPQRHKERGRPTASLTAHASNLQMLWGWCQAMCLHHSAPTPYNAQCRGEP